MWFIRYRERVTLETILILIGIVAVLIFVMMLKKHAGRLPGTDGTEFLPNNTNYGPILASVVIGLVSLAASMAAGAAVAYYLIFLMVALLFVLLVYYTVKLM